MKAADFSEESEETKRLYGIDDKVASLFSRNCLLGRRLIERGVRFVQLISSQGGGAGWDTHSNIVGALPGLCKSIDQGMSALLIDLKRRGLLEDTLIVWSGELDDSLRFSPAAPGQGEIITRTALACGWPERA